MIALRRLLVLVVLREPLVVVLKVHSEVRRFPALSYYLLLGFGFENINPACVRKGTVSIAIVSLNLRGTLRSIHKISLYNIVC